MPETPRVMRNLAGLGLAVLLVLVDSSVALAYPKFDQTTRLRLSAQTAGQGTEVLAVSGVPGPPGDPAVVPKEARTMVLALPAGTSLRSGAPQCTVRRGQVLRLRRECRVGVGVMELIVRGVDPQGNVVPSWCRSSLLRVYHVVRLGLGHWLDLSMGWDPTTNCPLARGGAIFLARIGGNGRTITVDLANEPHLFFVLRIKSRGLFPYAQILRSSQGVEEPGDGQLCGRYAGLQGQQAHMQARELGSLPIQRTPTQPARAFR